MKKFAELVFVPAPGAGHLVSTVEIAKLLVDRDDRLYATVLIMKLPFDPKVVTYTESLAASNLSDRIRFITLPGCGTEPTDALNLFSTFVESHKTHVREAVTKHIESQSGPESPRLAGFVLDLFCMCMMDVADGFEVPSYVFYTSGAAIIGLILHLQALHDEQSMLITKLEDSDAELEVPSLVNPMPATVLPPAMFKKDWADFLFDQARRYRQVKGIIVNTFSELEPHAIRSLDDGKTPPLYPVGPILNLNGDNYNLGPGGVERKAEIMTWLDDQPPSSVVFLCFGSMGSFGEDQVKEIARGLEQSGHRFLWSVRRTPRKDKYEPPGEYTNLTDILPGGFLDGTADIGKIVGWAPQVAVLSHPSVGGFISHCGWNSTLESLWFGVPIATWPMYAEQQFNAFELVRELGLATEIKMVYNKDAENLTIVSAEEIARGIKSLMDPDSEIRRRAKEMSEKSRKALKDGGSSLCSMDRFIHDVSDSIS